MIQVSKYPSIQVSILGYLDTWKYIKTLPLKNQGVSLTSTLIAVLIMGISFAEMLSMLTTQQKEAKATDQQFARGHLKYAILQILRSPDNRICQFNILNIGGVL